MFIVSRIKNSQASEERHIVRDSGQTHVAPTGLVGFIRSPTINMPRLRRFALAVLAYT
jgi:hypothetical protein